MNVDDRDKKGKNILHHLFTSAKYCTMCAEVLMNAFTDEFPRLKGNYRKAISHKVKHGTPTGWNPFHVLCHGSDHLLMQVNIVKVMLDNKFATVQDFDSSFDPQVIVFVFCLDSIHPFRREKVFGFSNVM